MNFNEGKVIPVDINHEMKRCYIDYAMSVIVGRALPDVRDEMCIRDRPLNAPYFSIASIAYCEHVGIYLHLGGVIGEILFL